MSLLNNRGINQFLCFRTEEESVELHNPTLGFTQTTIPSANGQPFEGSSVWGLNLVLRLFNRR